MKEDQKQKECMRVNWKLFGKHTLQLLSEHGQENSEVDGATGLLHHGLQLLILHIQLAHGGQHVPEVILADNTISVLVNDCKSLQGESKIKKKRIQVKLNLICCGLLYGSPPPQMWRQNWDHHIHKTLSCVVGMIIIYVQQSANVNV